MKKLVLTMLLLALAGVSLAETPKIINPPRPQKDYRLLLFVEHKVEYLGYTFRRVPAHRHFIYCNSYKVLAYNLWLEIIGPYEEYRDSINKSCKPYEDKEKGKTLLMIAVGEIRDVPSFVFLIAKAPKPSRENLKIVKSLNNTEIHESIPQKAKVIFTN